MGGIVQSAMLVACRIIVCVLRSSADLELEIDNYCVNVERHFNFSCLL